MCEWLKFTELIFKHSGTKSPSVKDFLITAVDFPQMTNGIKKFVMREGFPASFGILIIWADQFPWHPAACIQVPPPRNAFVPFSREDRGALWPPHAVVFETDRDDVRHGWPEMEQGIRASNEGIASESECSTFRYEWGLELFQGRHCPAVWGRGYIYDVEKRIIEKIQISIHWINFLYSTPSRINFPVSIHPLVEYLLLLLVGKGLSCSSSSL